MPLTSKYEHNLIQHDQPYIRNAKAYDILKTLGFHEKEIVNLSLSQIKYVAVAEVIPFVLTIIMAQPTLHKK